MLSRRKQSNRLNNEVRETFFITQPGGDNAAQRESRPRNRLMSAWTLEQSPALSDYTTRDSRLITGEVLDNRN